MRLLKGELYLKKKEIKDLLVSSMAVDDIVSIILDDTSTVSSGVTTTINMNPADGGFYPKAYNGFAPGDNIIAPTFSKDSCWIKKRKKIRKFNKNRSK
jgi:hypothetical protein